MPTPDQIRTIQTAKSWLMRNRGFTDDAYRTVLRSVAKVESSKDPQLDNAGFEQVMAVLESHGFQSHPRGPTYWRDKAAGGGGRQVWKIHALAAEPAAKRYELTALCLRFSDGRTDRPEKLHGQEAYALIEMLKSVIEREGGSDNYWLKQHGLAPRKERQHAAATLFG